VSQPTGLLARDLRKDRLGSECRRGALAAEAGVPEGSNLPIREIFRCRYGMRAGTIIGDGSYIPNYLPPNPNTGLTSNATPFWMAGGSVAEVEIDTETGQIRVTRL
jgi:hypothetical protein